MSGNRALAEGRFEDALRWLNRARRLAPNDHAVALTLATIHLGGDPSLAVRLAADVVAAAPSREAWLCLIAARYRAGQTGQAIADLRLVLSRFTVDDALATLANTVCAAAPFGWCGIGIDGRLLLPPTADVRLQLDGKVVRPPAVGLPPRWGAAKSLRITTDRDCDAIGSPIDLAAIRRIEGVVEAAPDGGLQGWCWQPGAPEVVPRLEVRDAGGQRRPVIADGAVLGSQGLFARHRAFAVGPDRLAGLRPPLRLRGPDGRDLLGSPIDPWLESRSAQDIARAQSRPGAATRMPAFVAVPASARGTRLGSPRKRRPAVVIPVFNGGAFVASCLDSVIAHTPRPVPIIVVDDGSTDAAVVAHLDRLAAAKSIRLVRHPSNRGFPAAANTGMRAAAAHDVILLNSDVLTPPGWLDAVRAAAYAAPDIGTASPLSNDATILNYPGRTASPAPQDIAATSRLAAQAARAAGDSMIEVPTTVGFCMYIRRDCLDDVGGFREDLFAQGYGEENDFCLRARHLGWRHVAALGTYVAHRGGASFGAAKQHLIKRNLAILERLHPGWLALVEAHSAADPLFAARRRLDRLRWRDSIKPGQRSVILVTHDDGGGVERVVQQRIDALASDGLLAVVLRPAEDQSVRVYPGRVADLPDLRYRLPEELAACTALLKGARPVGIEFHHMLAHHPALLNLPARLSVPYTVVVHDYACICPRVTLVNGSGQYCGEPDARACDRCVADAGRMIEEEIDTASLRRRSAEFLSGAATVTTPSSDTRGRLRRHFPALPVLPVPHEDDNARPPRRRPPVPSSVLVVAIVGALGVEKGYRVLLQCARDAADRDLGLRFVLIGHSIDDPRLLQTGRCFVTGPYLEGEATALITQEGAQLGLIPSIWPETWCFALSEIWRAGLPAVCFDIGAPAERIRATGDGFVLPLGLGPAALNNALLAAARQIGHV